MLTPATRLGTVDAGHRRQVLRGWQTLAGLSLALGDRPPDLVGDLLVQVGPIVPVELDIDHDANDNGVIRLEDAEMTILAPHRPSGREADEWDERYRDDRIDRSRVDAVANPLVVGPPIVEDGVIFEAQRRARRRRTTYLIGASALAIAAGAFAMFAGSSIVPDQGSEHGGESSGFSAPVDEAEIVAEWSKLHVGWVYVYDDGRVVWWPDPAVRGAGMQGILVQRLTPNGLELVRAGVIAPRTLLVDRDDVPLDAWSDPTPDEYLPSKYALCTITVTDNVATIYDVGAIRDRLPLYLQTLLRGTERTITNYDNGAEPESGARAGAGRYRETMPGRGVDCFVLSPEQALAVWAQGDPRDQAMMLPDDTSYATLTASDGAELKVVFSPILPDGGWVQFGG